MKAPLLSVEEVSFAYGDRQILQRVSFVLEPGTFTALLGPNGAGKTTLIKSVLGLLAPLSGTIRLEGVPVRELSPKERAKRMAYVSQEPFFTFPLTVEAFVGLGRYPHGRGGDHRPCAAVESALEAAGCASLRDRLFTTLSGGERQKVLVARALAQSRCLLLLDEPTAHLDLSHQMRILERLKTMCKEEGLTVLAVLHDLNLASLFSDRVLLMKGGALSGSGPVALVLTERSVADVFDTAVATIETGGSRYFLPLASEIPSG